VYGNPDDWPEQLAIITGATYGWDERGGVGLSLGVSFYPGYGAGLHLREAEAAKFLKEEEITDVAALRGKPCVVAVEPGGGSSYVRFVRLFKY
jgi:hypothetical protein